MLSARLFSLPYFFPVYAITETMMADVGSLGGLTSGGRRFHRARNHLSVSGFDWNTGRSIPVDQPDWEDMVRSSFRTGVIAARKTLRPALAVWGMMGCIAAVYFLIPASHGLFSGLITLQKWMGVFFPSLGMGLSVGLLVEVMKILISGERRWTRVNTVNAVFNFAVFGVMGFTQYYRYAFQNQVFGDGHSLRELASKVLFDQFVWTVLFANPYQAVLYLWKNHGFSWRAVAVQLFPMKTFWGTKMLPVLISNWVFWIPMAFMVYSFPPELQIPFAILAVTIWVLLLSVLTSRPSSR